uniref:Uncharacterized protein n=1 Tax=Anopheles farauti TaxID=69004 RepID=A0A182QPQ7_9DIPT
MGPREAAEEIKTVERISMRVVLHLTGFGANYATSTYTPGTFGMAQPAPKLTMPATRPPEHSNPPPESPWQASRPGAPAHSMPALRTLSNRALHVPKSLMTTLMRCRYGLIVVDRSSVTPHPAKLHRSPSVGAFWMRFPGKSVSVLRNSVATRAIAMSFAIVAESYIGWTVIDRTGRIWTVGLPVCGGSCRSSAIT